MNPSKSELKNKGLRKLKKEDRVLKVLIDAGEGLTTYHLAKLSGSSQTYNRKFREQMRENWLVQICPKMTGKRKAYVWKPTPWGILRSGLPIEVKVKGLLNCSTLLKKLSEYLPLDNIAKGIWICYGYTIILEELAGVSFTEMKVMSIPKSKDEIKDALIKSNEHYVKSFEESIILFLAENFDKYRNVLKKAISDDDTIKHGLYDACWRLLQKLERAYKQLSFHVKVLEEFKESMQRGL